MLEKTHLERLKKLQNKSIKAINPRQSTDMTRSKHQILTVSQLVKLENCKIWQRHKLGILLKTTTKYA